jgi:hypothetical protein
MAAADAATFASDLRTVPTLIQKFPSFFWQSGALVKQKRKARQFSRRCSRHRRDECFSDAVMITTRGLKRDCYVFTVERHIRELERLRTTEEASGGCDASVVSGALRLSFSNEKPRWMKMDPREAGRCPQLS